MVPPGSIRTRVRRRGLQRSAGTRSEEFFYEIGRRRGRLFDVLFFGPPRLRRRLEGVISSIDRVNPDRRRKVEALDLLAVPERIAGALEDEGARLQRLQVRRPEARSVAGWMEGVTKTDQPARADLVGDHARDSPAKRLAADDDPI